MYTRARSRAAFALLVLVAGFAIAACGSSATKVSASASSAGASTSTTSTGASATAGRGGFAGLTATQRSCLKAKGLTLPTGGGRGFGTPAGTGTFTRPTGSFTAPTGTPPGGTSTTGGAGTRPGGGFPGGGGRGAGGANATKFAAAFKACGVSFGGGQRGSFGASAGAGSSTQVSSTAIKAFVACVKQHGYDLTDVNTSGKGSVLPAALQKNKKFLAAATHCTSLLRSTGAGGQGTTAAG